MYHAPLPGHHLTPKVPELAQTQTCENFVESFSQLKR